MKHVKMKLYNIITKQIKINMGKIYDCFNFFNELDILEIRLNVLYEYVDYFVIVESSVTHSGEQKPFYFEENKERYSKFLDKIIHYKVYDTPSNFANLDYTEDTCVNEIFDFVSKQTNRFNRITQPDYGRDFFQKECVRRPLISCSDDDIIIISDADEIPNPVILENIHNLSIDDKIYSLNQTTYYYYVNLLKQTDWYGSKISKYKNIKNLSFNEVRGDESLSIKIDNGGWHFSFQGGNEMVKTKLLSYSARDLVNNNVLSNLTKNIENNIDPFFRGRLTHVKIDESYPKYLVENLEKYEHMVKK
jgi:beta-1,4-mannosyl-glycoprotein beta-1,4-N-acetylglucosaminyltransferase